MNQLTDLTNAWPVCRQSTLWIAASAKTSADVLNQVNKLQANLAEVRAKHELLRTVKSSEFWVSPSFDDLETMRTELRGIMKYMERPATPTELARVIDIKEDAQKTTSAHPTLNLDGVELAAYRQRVTLFFERIFDESPVLQKIKEGKAVTESELESFGGFGHQPRCKTWTYGFSAALSRIRQIISTMPFAVLSGWIKKRLSRYSLSLSPRTRG